ncbi:MAG: hypothetical protein ACI9PU_000720, partial [Ascidiaceihabitans sp.]
MKIRGDDTLLLTLHLWLKIKVLRRSVEPATHLGKRKDKNGPLEGQSSTIYHLGISKENETFGFMSRPNSNFLTEEMEHGWGVKPECEQPKEKTNLACGIEKMMAQKHKTQDTRHKMLNPKVNESIS